MLRRILTIGFCGVIATASGIGCNKNLDENKAKDLINNDIAISQNKSIGLIPSSLLLNGHVAINLLEDPQVARWLSAPTVTNLASYGSDTSQNAFGKGSRLLSVGFLSQKSTVVEYPLPSRATGRAVDKRNPQSLYGPIAPPQADMSISLSIDPSTGIIDGTYDLTGATPNHDPCHSTLYGNALVNGQLAITLRFNCMTGSEKSANVNLGRSGNLVSLIWPTYSDINDTIETVLTGPSTGSPVRLTWFNYSLSPSAIKWEKGANQYEIGSLHAVSVSKLVLTGSDVESHANFEWRLDLNDLGRAVVGNVTQLSGSGTADFAKTPNGTWTLSNYTF
jgi:hypothetical protein